MEIGGNGRRLAARIALGLSVLAGGAYVTAMVLSWLGLIADDTRRDMMQPLLFVFMVLMLANNMLDPRDHVEVEDPSPKVIGVIVVAATGLAASAVLLWSGWSIEASIVLIITWIVMLFVWRFARRHAGEIGEARFRGE